MSKLESLDGVLPSEARTRAIEFFLEQLENSGLNCYANPIYDGADALRDSEGAGSWARLHAIEWLREAKKLFDKKWAKGWDADKKCPYRYCQIGGVIHKLYPR